MIPQSYRVDRYPAAKKEARAIRHARSRAAGEAVIVTPPRLPCKGFNVRLIMVIPPARLCKCVSISVIF